eukprot:4454859-Amphidinium_carterae.1
MSLNRRRSLRNHLHKHVDVFLFENVQSVLSARHNWGPTDQMVNIKEMKLRTSPIRLNMMEYMRSSSIRDILRFFLRQGLFCHMLHKGILQEVARLRSMALTTEVLLLIYRGPERLLEKAFVNTG